MRKRVRKITLIEILAFCMFTLGVSSVIAAKPGNEGTVNGIDTLEKNIVISTFQYHIADGVQIRNFIGANTLSAIKVGQFVLFNTNANNDIIEIWVAPDDPNQRKLFDLGQLSSDDGS